MELSHFIGALLPLKSLIKEVIDNLGIDNENLKFMSPNNLVILHSPEAGLHTHIDCK